MPNKRRRSYVLCMAMRCDLRVLPEEESAWFETCRALYPSKARLISCGDRAWEPGTRAAPQDEVSWHETCVRIPEETDFV